MINNDRIVPIQKIDFLSLIATVLNLIGTSFAKLASKDVLGNFSVTGSGSVGNKLADQPVKTLDFASGVTAGTVYFVPDYAFTTITVNGTESIGDSGLDLDDVKPDGISLYKAVLATGEVTITAVTI